MNIFQGPNRQGKTNTILAIYWAITDFLMDGSSDFASFKPLDDTKKKVSVELEFDTFKLKKEFYEKWTKTRGSEEETMTGHNTDYYIDDIKTKVTDAKKELMQKFGIDGKTDIAKFDLLRAVMDPYYLAKNDWKATAKNWNRRQFSTSRQRGNVIKMPDYMREQVDAKTFGDLEKEGKCPF